MADILILNLRKGNSTIHVTDCPTWTRRVNGIDRPSSEDEAISLCAGGRVCVLFHGYRVGDAIDAYAEVADRIEDWNAYDVIIFIAWAGGKLVLAYIPWFLKKLTPWDLYDRAKKTAALAFAIVKRLRAAAVDAQTHSFGTRTALEAIKLGLVVRNLILSAGAVPRGCFRPGSEFSEVPARCKTIVVACSKRDDVLAGAFTFAEWCRALGYDGPLEPIPPNMVVVRCDDVAGHSGYKRSAAYLEAWRALVQ